MFKKRYVLKFKILGLKSMYVVRVVFSPKKRSSLLTEKYLFTVENIILCNIKEHNMNAIVWHSCFPRDCDSGTKNLIILVIVCVGKQFFSQIINTFLYSVISHFSLIVPNLKTSSFLESLFICFWRKSCAILAIFVNRLYVFFNKRSS